MFQFNLHFSYTRDSLKDYLEKSTGKPISLILTDNATSLISIRRKNNLVSVRMHWMFLNAGDEIIREIACLIKTRRGQTPHIRKFIRENQICVKEREPKSRQIKICTNGRFHNLREIFNTLTSEYFEGKITALITWRRGNKYAVKKRTLGSYSKHTNTILINSVLDRRNVPNCFIRYVVYHEMLHSVMEEKMENGRRSVHTPEFRKRERLFIEYEKAVSWEKRNLH
ncbi:MAG: SprT-like domain-containing protein [Nitrospirota bacterium]